MSRCSLLGKGKVITHIVNNPSSGVVGHVGAGGDDDFEGGDNASGVDTQLLARDERAEAGLALELIDGVRAGDGHVEEGLRLGGEGVAVGTVLQPGGEGAVGGDEDGDGVLALDHIHKVLVLLDELFGVEILGQLWHSLRRTR